MKKKKKKKTFSEFFFKTWKALDSFRPDGFVGIGVPIGTDNFVRQFVAKKCRDIIVDVEKLDAIEDIFIHYNRCVLQQQHVD